MKFFLTNQSLPGRAFTSNSLELLYNTGACLGMKVSRNKPSVHVCFHHSLGAKENGCARHCVFLQALPNNADLCFLLSCCIVDSCLLGHSLSHLSAFSLFSEPAFEILFQWLLPRIHSISIFPLHASKGHEGNSSISMGPDGCKSFILLTEWVHLL